MRSIGVIFMGAGINVSARPRMILEGTSIIFTSIDVNGCCFWLSIKLIFGFDRSRKLLRYKRFLKFKKRPYL